MQFNLVGVELSHFRRLADQSIQPIAFLVDHGEQFPLLRLV
jgi:hypothetical protein